VGTYYGGHGRKVMADFKTRYGSKKGLQAFYATVHKMQSGSKAQRAAQPSPKWGPR
jgi:hypothetical protein